MSSITLFVALAAIACIFWSSAKVLAVATFLLIAGSNPPAAIFALSIAAVLFYFIKIKRK